MSKVNKVSGSRNANNNSVAFGLLLPALILIVCGAFALAGK